MITTKQINVNLSRGKLKLRHITTKNIEVGVRVEPPKEPIKKKSLASITTTTLPDVADIAEKKRRDDIMAEKRLAMKDEKKIVFLVDNKGDSEIKKKPWKEMTDDEKKVAYKERAQRAKATRETNKKKKDKKK